MVTHPRFKSVRVLRKFGPRTLGQGRVPNPNPRLFEGLSDTRNRIRLRQRWVYARNAHFTGNTFWRKRVSFVESTAWKDPGIRKKRTPAMPLQQQDFETVCTIAKKNDRTRSTQR